MNPSVKECHRNFALSPTSTYVVLSSLIVLFSLKRCDHPCYFIPFLCCVGTFRFFLALAMMSYKTIKQQQSKWEPLVQGERHISCETTILFIEIIFGYPGPGLLVLSCILNVPVYRSGAAKPKRSF